MEARKPGSDATRDVFRANRVPRDADYVFIGSGIGSLYCAALLAKDLQWYGQHGWGEEPRVEYLWPRWTGAAGGEYRLGLSKAAAKARSAAAEAAEAAEAKQLRRSRRQNTAGGVAAAPPSLDSFRFTKRARQSL